MTKQSYSISQYALVIEKVIEQGQEDDLIKVLRNSFPISKQVLTQISQNDPNNEVIQKNCKSKKPSKNHQLLILNKQNSSIYKKVFSCVSPFPALFWNQSKSPNQKQSARYMPLQYNGKQGLNDLDITDKSQQINDETILDKQVQPYYQLPAINKDENRTNQDELFQAIETGNTSLCQKLINLGEDISKQTSGQIPYLHEAVLRGDLQLVQLFLDQGANIDTKQEQDESTALHLASSNGSIDICRLLIQKGAQSNQTNNKYESPLHIAASKGYPSICQLLLDNGTNINSKGYQGDSPLHYAASLGYLNVCQLLINQGANINQGCDVNNPPMVSSIFGGHNAVCQYMIEQGADVNFVGQDGKRPLHYSSKSHNLEVCKMLLDKGATINVVDLMGTTPIDMAIKLKAKSVYELLIERGADIQSKDILGNTLLHSAAYVGLSELSETLISKGLEVNAVRKDQQTPLHRAVAGGRLMVCRTLVKKGAKVDQQDSVGDTPLHKVAQLNCSRDRIAQFLINKGANTELVNSKKQNCLHMAIENKSSIMFELLVKSMKNLNAQDQQGNTALHLASMDGSNKQQIALVWNGASIDLTNNDLDTPLHLAVKNGHLNTTQYLLVQGARVDSVNKFYETPLTIAISQNQKDIALLLVQHQAVVKQNFKQLFNKLEDKNYEQYRELFQFCLAQGDHNPLDKGKNLSNVFLAVLANSLDDVRHSFDQDYSLLDQQNNFGESFLHLAIMSKSNQIVELLLINQVNVNTKDHDGFTPLHLASRYGSFHIASYMIEYGAQINALNNDCRSPLHIAAYWGNLTICQLLLNQGADINSIGKVGNTPLHLAAQNGHREIIQYLITQNADTSIKNKAGFKAVDVAKNIESYKIFFNYKMPYDQCYQVSKNDTTISDPSSKNFEQKYAGEAVVAKSFHKERGNSDNHCSLTVYKILQQEENDNIARVKDLQETNTDYYLIMEYCDMNLASYINDKMNNGILLGKNEALKVIKQISQGLKFLHTQGIIHGNLKPENILVKDNQAKISNFSNSISLSDQAQNEQRKDSLNEESEINDDKIGIDAPSFEGDIFSLGILMFYVLSGGQKPLKEQEISLNYPYVKQDDLELLVAFPEAQNLVQKILNRKLQVSVTMKDVLEHPMFWKDSQKISYLMRVSDFIGTPKKSDTIKEIKSMLEEVKHKVFNEDIGWDIMFEDPPGMTHPFKCLLDSYKRTKLNNKSFWDLIMFYRNCVNTYSRVNKEEEVHRYFTEKFPNLFIVSYQVFEVIESRFSA